MKNFNRRCSQSHHGSKLDQSLLRLVVAVTATYYNHLLVAGFVLSILRLLLNPVFMFLVLSSCLFGFAMNGLYLFLPKYLQHQFDIPAWKANFIMGQAQAESLSLYLPPSLTSQPAPSPTPETCPQP